MEQLKGTAERTLAITMWDISWLELHGEGQAFENWETCILELKERGYDAVRIDPYVHLIALDAEGTFALEPVWSDYGWGSPVPCVVKNLCSQLIAFMQVCRKNDILVALSSWYRHCEADRYVAHITDGKKLAQIWIELLRTLKAAGVYESILYVDFCNEYPLWAEFLPADPRGFRLRRDEQPVMQWTHECITAFKAEFPEIPVTFSVCSDFYRLEREDLGEYDFFEPHIWIDSDGDGRFEDNLKRYLGEVQVTQEELFLIKKSVYEDGQAYWNRVLEQQISLFAALARKYGKPLITTECWAFIFYKDSALGWDWIKDICEKGVGYAVREGVWSAIGTSNFCAPQFKGMWEDISWHRRMTGLIHES